MILSRRSVLFGLLAAPIVVRPGLLMPVRVDVPWIVGDGVHDDGPGLNAFLRGDRCKITQRMRDHVLEIDGQKIVRQGLFYMSEHLKAHDNALILGNTVNYAPGVEYGIEMVGRNGIVSGLAMNHPDKPKARVCISGNAYNNHVDNFKIWWDGGASVRS